MHDYIASSVFYLDSHDRFRFSVDILLYHLQVP